MCIWLEYWRGFRWPTDVSIEIATSIYKVEIELKILLTLLFFPSLPSSFSPPLTLLSLLFIFAMFYLTFVLLVSLPPLLVRSFTHGCSTLYASSFSNFFFKLCSSFGCLHRVAIRCRISKYHHHSKNRSHENPKSYILLVFQLSPP